MDHTELELFLRFVTNSCKKHFVMVADSRAGVSTSPELLNKCGFIEECPGCAAARVGAERRSHKKGRRNIFANEMQKVEDGKSIPNRAEERIAKVNPSISNPQGQDDEVVGLKFDSIG